MHFPSLSENTLSLLCHIIPSLALTPTLEPPHLSQPSLLNYCYYFSWPMYSQATTWNSHLSCLWLLLTLFTALMLTFFSNSFSIRAKLLLLAAFWKLLLTGSTERKKESMTQRSKGGHSSLSCFCDSLVLWKLEWQPRDSPALAVEDTVYLLKYFQSQNTMIPSSPHIASVFTPSKCPRQTSNKALLKKATLKFHYLLSA